MSTCEITLAGDLDRGAAPARFRIRRILELLEQWHERARQRRELQELPDYLLRDMGISPEDRYREIRKPFWRP